MMNRLHNRGLALLVGLVTITFVALGVGTASAAPRPADAATVNVAGTLLDGTGAVAGTFNVQRFVVQDGTLQAVGTSTGTVTDAAGALTSGSQQIALPVDIAQSAGTCEILNLVLRPLDLDLLGVVLGARCGRSQDRV